MSVRLRFRSFGLAALAAVTALSMVTASTGAELVAQTEAAYTDSEFARANVAAKWPLAFTSVIAGSAKSSTGTSTAGSDNMTYQSLSRWAQETTGSPTSLETSSGRPAFTVTRDYRLRGPGNVTASPNALPKDNQSLALHSWSAVRTFQNPGTQTNPQNNYCMVINESFAPASNDSRCGLGNSVAAATNDTAAYGFSVDIVDTYRAFLNAADIKTGVRCGLDTAVADPPTGRVDLGREFGGSDPYLRYTNTDSLRTIWANGISRNPDGYSASELPNGQLSPLYRIGVVGSELHAKVMPIITQKTETDPPYAISEVAAYVEYYDNDALSSLRAKMYFVLSRSECGVKGPTHAALPTKRSAFPEVMPGGNGNTRYTGGSYTPAAAPAEPMAFRAGSDTTTVTSPLPAITVTSPLENSTASEITTSAPPDPSGADATTTSGTTSAATTNDTTTPPATKTATTAQTTTTTSASPTTAIPTDPGTLSASADTTTVGTVAVVGDELDVVVKGDTVPADARTALTALDTWINEGARPSGDWRTFTSSEPDSDGWRWAAVNQATGTIVYIR